MSQGTLIGRARTEALKWYYPDARGYLKDLLEELASEIERLFALHVALMKNADKRNDELAEEISRMRQLEGLDAITASAIGTFIMNGDIPETIDRAKAVLVQRMLKAEARVAELEAENKALAEYKFMYESCSK